jgi:hypothetical protein
MVTPGQVLFPRILQIYDLGLKRVLELLREETVEPDIFLQPLLKRFQKEVAFFFDGLDQNSEKTTTYVIGGNRDMNVPMEKLVSERGWETVVEGGDVSNASKACVILDQIYLLGGGRTHGEVKRFDGEKMHTLDPLRYAGEILPLSDMSCAVVGSSIYMFGGRLDNTADTREWATRSMANRYVYRYVPPVKVPSNILPKDLWNLVHEYSGPPDNVERVNALNNIGGVFRYDPDSDVRDAVQSFEQYLYRNALAQNSRAVNWIDSSLKLCVRGVFIYIFGEDGLRKFDTRGKTSWSSDLSLYHEIDVTWNKTRNPEHCQRLSTRKSPVFGDYMDYAIGGDESPGFSIEQRRNGYDAVWEVVYVSPKSREGCAACILDNQVYVVGGKNCQGQILHYGMGEMQCATPLRVAGKIIDIYDHCCVAVGSVMYIFGGKLQKLNRINPYVYRYDYHEKNATIVDSYSNFRGGMYRFAFEDRMNTDLEEERSMTAYRAETYNDRQTAIALLSGDYAKKRQFQISFRDECELHREIYLRKFKSDGEEIVREFEQSFLRGDDYREEPALARAHGHCIYLFDRKTGDVLNKFDTTTNTWSTDFYPLVTLGGKRNYYSRIMFEDDFGYVFKGDGNNVEPAFGEFEPDLPREPDHVGEEGLNEEISGVHNVGNRILVVGGGVDGDRIRKYQSSGHNDEFLVHDGDIDHGQYLRWAASFIMDNHLYIAGGERKSGEDATTVLAYDLDTIESQWDKGPTSETRMTWKRNVFDAVTVVRPTSIIDGFLAELQNKPIS